MLLIPQKGEVRRQHNLGSVGSTTFGTAVTTGAVAATDGAAAELLASTNFDAYWLTVIAHSYGTSTTDSRGYVDILIGTSTEEVLIDNLLMGFCGYPAGTYNGPRMWNFPIYIPSGSRIAAKAGGARTNTVVRVGVVLYGGHGVPAFPVGQKVTTYDTSAYGVSVTPGASGAEGSWAEITSSTSEDHFALVPSFQPGAIGALNYRMFSVDIGQGAATEEVLSPSFSYSQDVSERFSGGYPSLPIFKKIPSGTRLVMRASNSGTNDVTPYLGKIHAVSA